MPKEEFVGIEIINSELLREFREDRKGILDVRAKTREDEQINIEIQILPTDFMAERTLFYWAKMYTGQINSGDTYNKLKKCITINIVDFICTPQKKLYSCYNLKERETGHKLTDVMEIYFLELPKLSNEEIVKDYGDPIVQWMMFIDTKSEGVLEMLSKKNRDIGKAFDYLQIISQDEKARMAYEARQAEIRDQLTRLNSAKEEGVREGRKEEKEQVAKNLLSMGVSIDIIVTATGLTEEDIGRLKNKEHKN